MVSWQSFEEGGLGRNQHAVVAVPGQGSDKGCIYSFGGFQDKKLEQTLSVYFFSLESQLWKQVSVPVSEASPRGRYGHTAVLYRRKVYIWGGVSSSKLKSVFCFDTESKRWSCPTMYTKAPETRWGHSACVIQGSMYIFGGRAANSISTNHMVSYDIKASAWRFFPAQSESQLPPRVFHSAAAIGSKMYVCGGTRGRDDCFLQVFDVTKDSWSTPISGGHVPPLCDGQSAFVLNNQMYLFGGTVAERYSNALYNYDPGNNYWRLVDATGTAPTPRWNQRTVVLENKAYIFDGTSPHPYIEYQWIYNDDLHVLHVPVAVKQPEVKEQPRMLEPAQSQQQEPPAQQMENLTMTRRSPKLELSTKQFYEKQMRKGKCFEMKGTSKGMVLIVNMHEVSMAGKTDIRSGGEDDKETLAALFTTMGFMVVSRQDMDHQELNKTITDFMKNAARMDALSVFVVLMSHGARYNNKHFILTKEGCRFYVRDEMERHFSSSNIPALARRPKVVIVQACQGGRTDLGVEVPSRRVVADSITVEEPPSPTRVPEVCNYYFAYAAQPEKKAYRHVDEGSWFINEIDHVFREEAATKHLNELMTEVRMNVQARGEEEGMMQAPEAIDCLTKLFYIFPGIH